MEKESLMYMLCAYLTQKILAENSSIPKTYLNVDSILSNISLWLAKIQLYINKLQLLIGHSD